MSSDADQKGDGEAFDVVLVHGATGDGEGARVLRARPGQIEAGEVRPIRQGQPLAPGGEVVRLSARSEAPCLYDVKVDYEVPAAAAAGRERARAGRHARLPRELGPDLRAVAPRGPQLSPRFSPRFFLARLRSSLRTRSRLARRR